MVHMSEVPQLSCRVGPSCVAAAPVHRGVRCEYCATIATLHIAARAAHSAISTGSRHARSTHNAAAGSSRTAAPFRQRSDVLRCRVPNAACLYAVLVRQHTCMPCAAAHAASLQTVARPASRPGASATATAHVLRAVRCASCTVLCTSQHTLQWT